MTVVFDTNVVIAALVTNGLCHEAFRRAARHRALVSSAPLLDELEATLRRKFVVTIEVRTFLRTLRKQIRLVEPRPLPAPVCRDPDDDVVLAARGGESPAAFDRRCIPTASVAPRSNTAGMLPRRALSSGRIAGLGATRDFHDGLLATAVAAAADRVVTGDQDLLVLGDYDGIPLLSPRQFVEWLDGRPDAATD